MTHHTGRAAVQPSGQIRRIVQFSQIVQCGQIGQIGQPGQSVTLLVAR
ncbi:hypothetical protein ABZX40_21280 [Streptomyces sp. NPDC004610]